ncbi:MAG: sulfotransferase [Phormidesmis sp.]
MTMPNFIVLGAGKAGTQSIYNYLLEHPDIYMSPTKETNFFALNGQQPNFQGPPDPINQYSIADLNDYQAQFANVTTEKAIGEISPLYLYSPIAPRRIKETLPNAKLIVILRNPVDRAYSCYLFLRARLTETITDFDQALQAEPERIDKNWPWPWHYKSLGFYYEQLQRYYQLFDPDQIKIYLYEDFRANNVAVMQDMFQYLEVDETFVPDVSLKYNFSGLPKNKVLQYLLTGPNPFQTALKPLLPTKLRRKLVSKVKKKNLTKPSLSPESRQQLIEAYREETLKLQTMLNRDLSHWLQV